MIQTETTKAKILMVEVPSDTIDFGYGEKQNILLHIAVDDEDTPYSIINLPQGNWTILNTLEEVTKDEARIIINAYFTHNGKSIMVHPLESLHSLATLLGVQGKTIILYELKTH